MTGEAVTPTFCTTDELTEYLEYLDDLRESGVTNMFGARQWLQDAFPDELSNVQARDVLLYWMRTFGERNGASGE